jgi:hypothetical protein
MRKREAIYIKWRDAQQVAEVDDAPGLGLIELHTFGWLVNEDDERIVVALEAGPWDHPGGWRFIVAIPKVNIVSRRSMKVREL